jgi:hypothetical protein
VYLYDLEKSDCQKVVHLGGNIVNF